MTDIVPVIKDPDMQQPVPTVWRKTFFDIVHAFKGGNFLTQSNLPLVCSVDHGIARTIKDNISSYGCCLCDLPEESWDTSVCQWMLDYWDVIIDLFTVEEGLSDLILSARIYEKDCEYEFVVDSVHVP